MSERDKNHYLSADDEPDYEWAGGNRPDYTEQEIYISSVTYHMTREEIYETYDEIFDNYISELNLKKLFVYAVLKSASMGDVLESGHESYEEEDKFWKDDEFIRNESFIDEREDLWVNVFHTQNEANERNAPLEMIPVGTWLVELWVGETKLASINGEMQEHKWDDPINSGLPPVRDIYNESF